MTRGRIWIGGLAAGALAVALAIVLGVGDWTRPAPADGDEVASASRGEEGRRRRRPIERAERVAKVKAKRPVATPELAEEERLAAREEYRDDRLVDVDERLDLYAAEAGWDPAMTEQVRAAILDNADDVSARLEAVTRGELAWEEVRDDLRQARIERADRVRRLLGDEEFDTFVREMDFARFLGDEPVWGRITRR